MMIQNKKRGYFLVENDLLDKWLRIIGPGAYVVYQELNRFCRGGEHIPFPNKTAKDWGAWIGISPLSFLKHIHTLADFNLIKVEEKRNKITHFRECYKYAILPFKVPSEQVAKKIKRFPQNIRFGDPLYGEPMFRDKSSDIECISDPESSDIECISDMTYKVCQYNSTGNNNTRNSVLAEKDNSFDPSDLPSHLGKNKQLLAAWERFVQHRKEKKAKITPTAYKMLIKKMLSYPPDIIIDALDRSVSNGWTGVFPESERTSALSAPSRPNQKLSGEEATLIHEYVTRCLGSDVADTNIGQINEIIRKLYEWADRLSKKIDSLGNGRGNDDMWGTGGSPLLSLLNGREFFDFWFEYLKEKWEKDFPIRSVNDLQIGKLRWGEFVKRCSDSSNCSMETGAWLG